MANTLYIIGNGFDLHHGIPSSYKAFGEYLQKRDSGTYDVVEKYFDVNAQFWAEFEEHLASFDSDLLIEDASDFLVSYAAEDWSDAYHHDYQYEIEQAVGAISKTLRLRFAEWISAAQDPSALGHCQPRPSSGLIGGLLELQLHSIIATHVWCSRQQYRPHSWLVGEPYRSSNPGPWMGI